MVLLRDNFDAGDSSRTRFLQEIKVGPFGVRPVIKVVALSVETGLKDEGDDGGKEKGLKHSRRVNLSRSGFEGESEDSHTP